MMFLRNIRLPLLFFIFFLFFLRVYGQAMVGIYQLDWLPTMEEWYSGIIPYPILFCSQLLILCLLFLMCIDAKYLLMPISLSNKLGKSVLLFSYIYGFVMVMRYLLTMWFFPEKRWLIGTIPIFMHIGLAIFLMTWVRLKQSQHERW